MPQAALRGSAVQQLVCPDRFQATSLGWGSALGWLTVVQNCRTMPVSSAAWELFMIASSMSTLKPSMELAMELRFCRAAAVALIFSVTAVLLAQPWPSWMSLEYPQAKTTRAECAWAWHSSSGSK